MSGHYYCHDCDCFEWRVNEKRGICLKMPEASTQFEKLQKILNNGLDYIYQKALLNFSTARPAKAIIDDEFNSEFTDPYCGMECIICSNYLDVCRCYECSPMKDSLFNSYDHFVDIEIPEYYKQQEYTTTVAVNFNNKITNRSIDF